MARSPARSPENLFRQSPCNRQGLCCVRGQRTRCSSFLSDSGLFYRSLSPTVTTTVTPREQHSPYQRWPTDCLSDWHTSYAPRSAPAPWSSWANTRTPRSAIPAARTVIHAHASKLSTGYTVKSKAVERRFQTLSTVPGYPDDHPPASPPVASQKAS